MYYVNKIVGGMLNPLGIGLMMIVLPICWAWWRKVRTGVAARVPIAYFLVPVAWLWVWSSGIVGMIVGLALEREFPPKPVSEMPSADAIVVLGGGVALNTNSCVYADIQDAADRVWHGARLWKAGKAERIFVTCKSDALLMEDFGVPREAIVPPTGARNTEEEAKRISEAMREDGKSGRPKILLVTSAWHMRRARLMFERYARGVEIVPAATDHVSATMFGDGIEFLDFVPDCVALGRNSYMFKEWLAYYGYKWLRR